MRAAPHRLATVVLTGALALLALAWWGLGSTAIGGETVRLGARAPEISGGPWIGSAPLTLAALQGRVVLVEFWTYG